MAFQVQKCDQQAEHNRIEHAEALGLIRKSAQKATDALLAELQKSTGLEKALLDAEKCHKKAARVSILTTLHFPVMHLLFLLFSDCKFCLPACLPEGASRCLVKV